MLDERKGRAAIGLPIPRRVDRIRYEEIAVDLHFTGRHVGTRLQDFRKAWETACRKAQVVGMLRHDMRRSAVRNLVNAGVSERGAMTVTGHKTRSVFDRYHIVSPANLQDAARKLTDTMPGTNRRVDTAR
jgi:integrase